MSACNFEYLLQLVNKQLDMDKQFEVYDHLSRCDICREAVYQLSSDLDIVSLIYYAHRVKHNAFRRQTGMAKHGRVQASANALAPPTMRRSSNRP
jgi:hypothetical protein